MTPGEIVDLRARLYWSQEHLAQELGISRSTVARWETGKRSVPPMASMALSWLLVNYEMLLEEKGPPSPAQ
jgi:DNA-binding transcriptional regulator YiaG